ncbi:CcdC protein domain-containing protein [Caulobacter sp. 17J80-11]|uniref:CcdC protein domain-containing protein n=1 Tax=Caulobacter sp. 17J80-11 TaxID=2763502 RepID=UPI00165377C9|nr:CcdC protein domain-containing protein [Caulobacter sp. 17J80-11]MBC6980385.1 DUF1453 family protein [Caulobacter sp. 17J80-11]
MSVSTTTPQYLPYLIPVAVIALIILRNRRERRLRLELMWILPAFMLLGAGAALYYAPGPHPGPAAMVGLALALALGGVLGWVRGRTIRIQHDSATGALTAQASPLGMLLILAMFAIRYPLSLYAQAHPEALHVSPTILADGFLLFAVGLVLAQRIEVALRARKLMAAAPATA